MWVASGMAYVTTRTTEPANWRCIPACNNGATLGVPEPLGPMGTSTPTDKSPPPQADNSSVTQAMAINVLLLRIAALARLIWGKEFVIKVFIQSFALFVEGMVVRQSDADLG